MVCFAVRMEDQFKRSIFNDVSHVETLSLPPNGYVSTRISCRINASQ